MKKVIRINTNDNISDMKGGGVMPAGLLFIVVLLMIILLAI